MLVRFASGRCGLHSADGNASIEVNQAREQSDKEICRVSVPFRNDYACIVSLKVSLSADFWPCGVLTSISPDAE